MPQLRVWTWEEEAEALLEWSGEDQIVRVLGVATGRVLFEVHFGDIENFRVFQTLFGELAIRFVVHGKKYRVICTKAPQVGLWFMYKWVTLGLVVRMLTFSVKRREERSGLGELRRTLQAYQIKVERRAYPRNITLITCAGILAATILWIAVR